MQTTRRFGGFLIRRAIEIVAISLVLTSVPVLVETASAQELVRRQNFFERLFSRPSRRQPPVIQPQRPVAPAQRAPRRQRATKSPQKRATASAPAPAPAQVQKPEIEKAADAKVILVVGDFLAGSVAGGLENAYEERPGVRVDDRSNGSSGFVRNDYYDWNGSITPMIEQVKPSAVVVFLGSNDRQQLTVNGQSYKPQTEQWLKEYTARVTAFADKLKASKVPFIWVGLLPFKSPAMTSDMLVFSDIQEKATEAAGGTFVDIWGGFVDDNGAFTVTGPNINGQSVKLRSSDGINFTRDAKRKIAFYVEKPLNQILGTAALPTMIDGIAMPQIMAQPVASKDLTRTGPISLADPGSKANGGLLGGQTWAPAQSHPQSKPQPGRADFMMQRSAD